MADFISSSWNLYVMALVAVGLLFCLIILLTNITARQKGEPKLQGHVWDENLREYNNPLPSWWLYLFWVTVLFAIGYLYVFPGFGTWNSNAQKDLGLRSEYRAEIKKAEEVYSPIFAGYVKENGSYKDLVAVAADTKAMEGGQRLYMTYCMQCHGSAGKGGTGFPDLTDNDWLYGGTPDVMKTSIMDGHAGVMTPFGGSLSEEQIKDVANYVRSLAGLEADAARASRGREVFAANCVICHGPDGKGALSMGEAFGALGAPNLTDNIWLYGPSEETIIEGITKGRNAGPGSLTNSMPAWKDFLGEDKVHLLAAYVYSLSKH
jgi:cytochrome c oxidase cbb3-type subunit 3